MPELLTCLVAFAKQGWQPPKSLKFIAVGGARVSDSLILTAREYNLPVYQGYGLSCLLYTSPSPRDGLLSRMPSSA